VIACLTSCRPDDWRRASFVVFRALAEHRRNVAAQCQIEHHVSQRAVPGTARPRRRAVVSLRLWRSVVLQLGRPLVLGLDRSGRVHVRIP
jgi:hypothetical protein